MRHKTLPSTSHRPIRAKRVGQFMEKAMGKGLKKRGFANADLIAHWPQIVPATYAHCTLPEKLIWPRPNGQDESQSNAHLGAILMLQVAQAQKLAVDYEKDAIRHAINAYFGFELVGQIRLSKYPLNPQKKAPVPERKANKAQIAQVQEITKSVDDDGLRAALRKLGQNLAAKNN